ncbi:rhodanese-like domain-containing protein [Thiocapsa sp.]|uniref:rhodanese-like domain-containing protein n=1 Tax=Thiocapsa sp. TaxID=2024551 RepID=UPI0025E14B1A|nr:rhodanese-like domain-containing protein [Thiocapsa sp.]
MAGGGRHRHDKPQRDLSHSGKSSNKLMWLSATLYVPRIINVPEYAYMQALINNVRRCAMSRARSIALMSAFVLLFGFGTTGWTYDANLADSYAKLFAPAEGAQTGKGLHCLKPEAFMNMIKWDEPVTTIDIRTPAEAKVFSTVLPGHLSIPLNELFLPANLERIPTDRTVVILCKSGIRAAAAGTALRHIGFDRVFILEGGFKALIDFLDPMTANSPPAEALPKR